MNDYVAKPFKPEDLLQKDQEPGNAWLKVAINLHQQAGNSGINLYGLVLKVNIRQ